MPPTPALFHIIGETQWAQARAAGEVRPDSLADEGFVHCSFQAQLAATLGRHFDSRDGLLVLELDPSRLRDPVRVEDSYGRGEAFPHVYGPLPVGAVVAVHPADTISDPGRP